MHNTLERTKQTVLAFYQAGLNRKDFPAALIGERYVQHNPRIADVHGIRVPGQPGTATVDIFRLDPDGRIVERRDVMQSIPDAAANENGMF